MIGCRIRDGPYGDELGWFKDPDGNILDVVSW
jgi:hypothetical protein